MFHSRRVGDSEIHDTHRKHDPSQIWHILFQAKYALWLEEEKKYDKFFSVHLERATFDVGWKAL